MPQIEMARRLGEQRESRCSHYFRLAVSDLVGRKEIDRWRRGTYVWLCLYGDKEPEPVKRAASAWLYGKAA